MQDMYTEQNYSSMGFACRSPWIKTQDCGPPQCKESALQRISYTSEIARYRSWALLVMTPKQNMCTYKLHMLRDCLYYLSIEDSFFFFWRILMHFPQKVDLNKLYYLHKTLGWHSHWRHRLFHIFIYFIATFLLWGTHSAVLRA